MSKDVLKEIIKKKIEKVDLLKKSISINSLNEQIDQNKTFINFKDKIQNNIDNNKISLIAEIKKASPSAGIIIDDYNPIEIAKIYDNNKVTCLSILTEEDFFLGNLSDISKVKEKINLPVLCKDFFIDKFQVPLAKSYGADAILIHSKEKTPTEIFSFAKEFKKSKNFVPLVSVPSTYSKVYEKDLIKNGFKLVIYANQLLRAAYPAMVSTAKTILMNSRAYEIDKKIIPIKEIINLIKND